MPRVAPYYADRASIDYKARWLIRKARISARTLRSRTSQSRTARPRITARTTSARIIRSLRKTGNSHSSRFRLSATRRSSSIVPVARSLRISRRIVAGDRANPAITSRRGEGTRARGHGRGHASHKMAEACASAVERNPFASA